MTFNHEGDLSSEGILYLPSQVDSLPVPEDWIGLIQRTKRSLLWRWNSMKPVGASCRDHLECATNYCRKNVCVFCNATCRGYTNKMSSG